jgi:hypothetical protein
VVNGLNYLGATGLPLQEGSIEVAKLSDLVQTGEGDPRHLFH